MYEYQKLELVYYRWGKTFEFLGVVGILFLSLLVPKKSMESALRMLGWERTTPEIVAGFSMFIGLLATLPVFLLTYPVSPLFGGLTTLMFFFGVTGLLYQFPDQLSFKSKYDFTFYTPLALEIVAVELLKHGNLSRAVETLSNMSLGVISDIIRINVVAPFYTQKRYSSLASRFIDWLQYECPSDVFSFYMLELVSNEPSEEQFNIIVNSAIETIFTTLDNALENSDWKIGIGIYSITIFDILLSLGLTLGSSKIMIQSIPFLTILLFIMFVIDIPLFTYVFIAPLFRRIYVVDEVKI